MERDFVPRTLATEPTAVLFVGAGGKKVAEIDRQRLLAEVRGGAAPAKLTVEATVFLQGDQPNRNFVRFKPTLLKRLAKSFVGMPFLRDHDRGVLARGGTVVASEFVGDKDGGEIKQTIELVKPWAIEAALDGTIDRFSIGWSNTAPVLCSECDAPFAPGFFGVASNCDHYPGDVVELKDGTKRVVEMVVTGADGVEVSAVSVPAVLGTGVDQIRSALALERQTRTHAAPAAQPPQEKSMKSIATKLGLAETADESTILAALERSRVEHEAAATLQAAELAAHGETRTALAEARDKLAVYAAAEHAAALEKVTAVVEGKLGKGEQSQKAIASALQIAKAIGVTEALAFAESLPKLSPVGEPLQSRGTAPDVAGERGVLTKLTAQQKSVAKQLKLTDAQYLAQLNAGQ